MTDRSCFPEKGTRAPRNHVRSYRVPYTAWDSEINENERLDTHNQGH